MKTVLFILLLGTMGGLFLAYLTSITPLGEVLIPLLILWTVSKALTLISQPSDKIKGAD